MRHQKAVIVAALIVLSAREAAGEPIYHFKSPSTITTERGSSLNLPPGYFLDEKTWQDRDLELKRAQEERTRFKAENESLRKSSLDGMSVTFAVVTLAIGVFTGFVAFKMTE